jgi:putative IMPACT (imprinted ancient) family translation regulator
MRGDDGVLVVVSRWFGGIHLGPKRFAHITNVARDLLVSAAESSSSRKEQNGGRGTNTTANNNKR